MAEQTSYRKLKCVFCGYELASRAKKPRCTKCGSKRLNEITEFSATKPFKPKDEEDNMKKKKAEETQEEPEEQEEEQDIVDKDLWG